ncbi:MAG: gamma-glutamylputrescine oxidase [Gammaproteobacteria bacterium]|nr:gamma-glutamylputrescine oxidase [Gammaproteobacteria bacterium]
MAIQPHAPSYYAVSAHPAPDRPALAGTVDCDVCVVGGGIAGCSTALHLAERGYRVVLLEENRIGWGASGRSGAQAIYGLASPQSKVKSLVGEPAARAIWDVTVEALDLIRELIAKHRIDCDWVQGHMLTAIKQRHDADIHSELEELRDQYQYRSVRYMPRDEVRSVLATERYVGALYDSHSGHLHPLNYTLGLAGAGERAGVQIFEGTRALDFTNTGGTATGGAARIRTSNGEVRSRFVVMSGNVYLGDTAHSLKSKIMAVATYIVATEPLGAERARALIANNAAVSDMNWVLDYFRLSADHRLLFGGRVNYSGLASFDAPSATRTRMLGVFPQLNDVRVEFAWGGDVDITLNRAPHFGRLAPNVYFLQGFSGHGIALTGIAGKLVAEAIAGTAERFDVFARIPHADFPGGAALRRPALVLAMLYYRIRDLL